MQSLFWKSNFDGSVIYLLDYIDDLLYYGTSEKWFHDFEKQLLARFDLKVLGQAHWCLACRISQLANYDIVLDQSRYYLLLMKRYLDKAGCANNVKKHTMLLPLDVVLTSDDNSTTDEAAAAHATAYNLDFASCIRALIYFSSDPNWYHSHCE